MEHSQASVIPERPIPVSWHPNWLVRTVLGASFSVGLGATLIGVGWKFYVGPVIDIPLAFVIAGLIGVIISGWLTIPTAFVLYAFLPWLSVRFCKGTNLLWSIPAHIALGALLGALPFLFFHVQPSEPPCAL
jgi:hypothetical protein